MESGLKDVHTSTSELLSRIFCATLVSWQCFLLTGLLLCHTSLAQAQNYPARTVRVVVPVTPGGGTDLVARMVSQKLSEHLGQPFVVENRPGAGNVIGSAFVASAKPDGYTLLVVPISHAVNVSLVKLPFDPIADFAPIVHLGSAPSLVTVHPSLPVKSIGELVKLAKAKPGAINYGSAGVGTSTYLAAELFKITAGVNLLEVPYRGGAPAQTAVIAGEVSVYFAPIATALPFVRERRLRALAVGTAKRLPMLPEYPTVAESGYPDYEASNWHGLVVPIKTSKEIIATLHTAALAALKKPEIAKRMLDLGFTPVGDQPEEFAAFIRADIEKWQKIVRQKGITAE
jgi:tripartite-type tricarboxylate transporter receptor subunit TctC